MLLSEAVKERIKYFLDKKEMTLWDLYKSEVWHLFNKKIFVSIVNA